jgi:hypothetical protein
MSDKKISKLHIVHCIDTEGPMRESLSATFQRLDAVFGIKLTANHETLLKLQQKQLDLGGIEEAVARMIAPDLLAYNENWSQIQQMLDELLSDQFRKQMLDDFGNGWVYSWHCMDHMRYSDNPRNKDVGYGNVFRFYREALHNAQCTQDEINWHFHPFSITKNALHTATSYTNSYSELNEILCRRILEDDWFPVVYRPGFHAERPDSHAFLEQWIPFDYANQAYEDEEDQRDFVGGRFGDWRRAPSTWRGYYPHHDDYQRSGSCRRIIFRCLNMGSRLRMLKMDHVRQAFAEAQEHGKAILSFSDHDYRDIRKDVMDVMAMLAQVRPEFPEVSIQFSGAEAAAIDLLEVATKPKLKLSIRLDGNRLVICAEEGQVFGPQPFLALRGREGRVFHDNLDVVEPGRLWTYILDHQTLPLSALASAGVGAAGRFGGFHTARLEIDG